MDEEEEEEEEDWLLRLKTRVDNAEVRGARKPNEDARIKAHERSVTSIGKTTPVTSTIASCKKNTKTIHAKTNPTQSLYIPLSGRSLLALSKNERNASRSECVDDIYCGPTNKTKTKNVTLFFFVKPQQFGSLTCGGTKYSKNMR